MNTLLNYLYRDANNYKQYGTVVFSGSITDDQIVAVTEHAFYDGIEGFIPSRVDLEDLQHRMIDGGNTENDHPYHELWGFEHVTDLPTDDRSIDQFVEDFLGATWA